MSEFNDILNNIIKKLEYEKDRNIQFYSSEIKSYKDFLNSKFDFKYQIAHAEENATVEEGLLTSYTQNLPEDSGIGQEPWKDVKTLDELEKLICDCKKCDLWKTRTNFVFGTGNPNAEVVVVGEAPGADEDKQGKPFVGRAGQLLTQILAAINFKREDVFICNVLKSRPPDNRNPLPEEIKACEPYLIKQLEIIKPKLLLCVGTFAAQTLLKKKEPLGKLRGKFHTYNGIPLMVTYHPAALLRNPHWKKPTWEDVQLFRKEYDRIIENK